MNLAFKKLCISVGLAKVKVGEVFNVIKTLFELMLAPPTWTKGYVTGTGSGIGVGVGVGVGVGLTDLQVEGWPVQSQFYWILHPTQPAEATFPVSQLYPVTIIPSPQTGAQAPWALAWYPASAQIMH